MTVQRYCFSSVTLLCRCDLASIVLQHSLIVTMLRCCFSTMCRCDLASMLLLHSLSLWSSSDAFSEHVSLCSCFDVVSAQCVAVTVFHCYAIKVCRCDLASMLLQHLVTLLLSFAVVSAPCVLVIFLPYCFHIVILPWSCFSTVCRRCCFSTVCRCDLASMLFQYSVSLWPCFDVVSQHSAQ